MWIWSLIATILGLSALFGAWIFYIPGREYYAFENAAYASLHRIAWALTVAWIIIGGCTTRFNVLQPILQLHAFLPLSRLTYCAFLVHGAVQLYFLGTLRQAEYMSFPKLVSLNPPFYTVKLKYCIIYKPKKKLVLVLDGNRRYHDFIYRRFVCLFIVRSTAWWNTKNASKRK
jgi:hypothetical protein